MSLTKLPVPLVKKLILIFSSDSRFDRKQASAGVFLEEAFTTDLKASLRATEVTVTQSERRGATNSNRLLFSLAQRVSTFIEPVALQLTVTHTSLPLGNYI